MTPPEMVNSLVERAAFDHMCAPERIRGYGGCGEVNDARRWVYQQLGERGWSYRRIARAMGRDHRAVMRAVLAKGNAKHIHCWPESVVRIELSMEHQPT